MERQALNDDDRNHTNWVTDWLAEWEPANSERIQQIAEWANKKLLKLVMLRVRLWQLKLKPHVIMYSMCGAYENFRPAFFFVQFIPILVEYGLHFFWIFMISSNPNDVEDIWEMPEGKRNKIERASRTLICEVSRLMLFNISIIFFLFAFSLKFTSLL